MLGSLDNAGIFLVNTLFDLYLFILAIRLILVWIRADYFNPLSQFVVKLTNPIITPLKRFLPNLGHIELASLVLIIVLEMLKFFLIGVLAMKTLGIVGLLVLAVADTLKTILNIFFYAILLQAILSWIQPGYSPFAKVLMQITAPIIRPIQRIIPPIGGFDLSPIPALIGLQLLIILLVTPLYNYGLMMAF